jgi:hypothetical protein
MKPMTRLCFVVLAAATVVSSGCYQKVVDAHGYGADRVALEQGNAPPEPGSRTLGYPKITQKKLPGE